MGTGKTHRLSDGSGLARFRQQWVVLSDAMSIGTVWVVVVGFLGLVDPNLRSLAASVGLAAAGVVFTIAGFWRRGLYSSPRLALTNEISSILSMTTLGTLMVALLAWITNVTFWTREAVLVLPLCIGAVIVLRALIRRTRGHLPDQHVVIVGTGEEAAEIVFLIADHPESGFHVSGIIGDEQTAHKNGVHSLWLGPTEDLVGLMDEAGATAAIITPTSFRSPAYRSVTDTILASRSELLISTGVTHIFDGRFSTPSIVHEPLVRMGKGRTRDAKRRVQRVVDLFGSCAILIVSSPILLAITVSLRLFDPGPVIFRQKRKGLHGQDVTMLKFRTMVEDAEAQVDELRRENERDGPIFKIESDPRVTRIGRFLRESSLDELPQLLNVVRGEMSLVGPRPALESEERLFDEEHRRRFEVRPGMTGLWQVEARRNNAFRAYRRLDLHYVENWSLALDLRIMVATAALVIVELLLLPFRRFIEAPMVRDELVVADSGSAPAETTVLDLTHPPSPSSTEGDALFQHGWAAVNDESDEFDEFDDSVVALPTGPAKR